MQPQPQVNAQNGAAVLIRCPTLPGSESGLQMFLHTLPAWIVSGVSHAVLLSLFLLVTVTGGTQGYETENVPTETKVEDFTITVNWLTIEGAEASVTCGMTMRANVCAGDMPAENAASRWPRGTPSMPARKVSAR